MPIIKTRINKDSDKFISNFEYHKTLSDILSERIQKVREDEKKYQSKEDI